MTLVVAFAPSSISLSHPFLVFLDCTWFAPVRKIITASGEDVHSRHGYTANVVGVLIPPFTTVNLQCSTPRFVNLAPLIVGQDEIMTDHYLGGIRMIVEQFQSLLRIIFVSLTPIVVSPTYWTVFFVKAQQSFAPLNAFPKPLRSFKIEEFISRAQFCLCWFGSDQKEAKHD